MTDYGTIKIPRDEYEQHNERRQDLGLSWAEYIDGQAPELPTRGEDSDVTEAVRTIEERTGRIERLLEDLQR